MPPPEQPMAQPVPGGCVIEKVIEKVLPQEMTVSVDKPETHIHRITKHVPNVTIVEELVPKMKEVVHHEIEERAVLDEKQVALEVTRQRTRQKLHVTHQPETEHLVQEVAQPCPAPPAERVVERLVPDVKVNVKEIREPASVHVEERTVQCEHVQKIAREQVHLVHKVDKEIRDVHVPYTVERVVVKDDGAVAEVPGREVVVHPTTTITTRHIYPEFPHRGAVVSTRAGPVDETALRGELVAKRQELQILLNENGNLDSELQAHIAKVDNLSQQLNQVRRQNVNLEQGNAALRGVHNCVKVVSPAGAGQRREERAAFSPERARERVVLSPEPARPFFATPEPRARVAEPLTPEPLARGVVRVLSPGPEERSFATLYDTPLVERYKPRSSSVFAVRDREYIPRYVPRDFGHRSPAEYAAEVRRRMDEAAQRQRLAYRGRVDAYRHPYSSPYRRPIY